MREGENFYGANMTKNFSAKDWIRTLNLLPHPEGGYFAETYRAKESVAAQALPKRFKGDRSFSTAIYFLIDGKNVSKLHRIKADELWHFYAGSAVVIHSIHPDGRHEKTFLGTDPSHDALPQAVVPAGVWFGAELADKNSFALVGCTVAPGFDFADFEMANGDELATKFPSLSILIKKLT